MKSTKKTGYTEPSGYFPKSVRKKAGIGEYEKSEKKSDGKKKVRRK